MSTTYLLQSSSERKFSNLFVVSFVIKINDIKNTLFSIIHFILEKNTSNEIFNFISSGFCNRKGHIDSFFSFTPILVFSTKTVSGESIGESSIRCINKFIYVNQFIHYTHNQLDTSFIIFMVFHDNSPLLWLKTPK